MKRSFMSLLRLLSISLLISAFFGMVHPALAQDDDLIVVIDEVIMDQYESDQIIQVYVTVRHPQGGAIAGLGPEDFTLNVSGGQPFVPDEAEMRDDAVVSLAVVLELYQTMEGKPLQDAKEAIKSLCTTKPPQDRVALFSVRHDVDPESNELNEDFEHEFTEDGGAVNNFSQGLDVVRGQGGTPLYDTLVKAMRYTADVSQEPIGRRAVVVITDGGDVGSRYNDQTVIDAGQKLKVPVYTIGYTGENRTYDQSLNEIANRTGGEYQNTPDTADFNAFLGDVRDEMSKHYFLTYEGASFASGRQILEVRVDASGLTGTDSQVFEVGALAEESTPTEAPETTTPESTAEDEDEDTEAGGDVEPTSTPEDEDETLLDKIEDNFALIAIIAGGVIVILIILIIVVRRVGKRSKKTDWPEEQQGYMDSLAPLMPSEPSPETPGEQVEAGTATASWEVDAEPPPELAPPPPMHTQVDSGFPPPQQTDDQLPIPPSQPAAGAPAPSQPYPDDARRSPTSGTVILDQGPKMAHYAMLIDQISRATYQLDQPAVSLGRSSDNYIKLDSEKVSRRHATIKLEGDVFRIYDLGSANGTFVNDDRVYEPVGLSDGDIVRLGDVNFIFKLIS